MYSYVIISIHADCGTDAMVCEVNVDAYLDNFCAQATITRNRPTISTPTTITSELPCPTNTITLPNVQLTTVTGTQLILYLCITLSMLASYIHTIDHKQPCMTRTPPPPQFWS